MNIEGAPDNSLREINLGQDLDGLTFEQRKKAVGLCRLKMRIGGRLAYSGYDLGDLTDGFRAGYVELAKFNEIINESKSISTLEEEVGEIEKLGLKVQVKRINNYLYYVEAVRESL